MRRPLALLLAALVTVAAVVVGVVLVVGDDGSEPAGPPASATPTEPVAAPDVPLNEVDTLTRAVRRDAFCAGIAPEAVEAALGAPAGDTTTYADGQQAALTGQVRDIAHEFGCGWTTPAAAVRAWVFAPPVTPATAKALLRAARTADGCRPVADAPAFGQPSLALTCDTPRGVQASFRGLFGDAWVTCTVAGDLPLEEVTERADRWCVAVLAGLEAS